MSKEKIVTVQDYILEALNQPVLIKGGDYAKDPKDGHQLTATEAIAMKMMQQALNGDLRAAQFVMQLQESAKIKKK